MKKAQSKFPKSAHAANAQNEENKHLFQSFNIAMAKQRTCLFYCLLPTESNIEFNFALGTSVLFN